MSNIAYKEWKERKREETRQKNKIEKLERRRALIEVEEQHLQRRHNVAQIQAKKKGGEVLLAYGLNKNLKKL